MISYLQMLISIAVSSSLRQVIQFTLGHGIQKNQVHDKLHQTTLVRLKKKKNRSNLIKINTDTSVVIRELNEN